MRLRCSSAVVSRTGIGSDRYEIGHTMELQLSPHIFLLDDGFQHLRLKRDLDIVLIDVTNPWGGGLFPLGQRREPLEALSRASAIVLTRVPPKALTSGIARTIRRYNANVPIFRSRMVPEHRDSPEKKVGAFCGIGSPASFWRTLEDITGLNVVYRRTFRDHHKYSLSGNRINCARRRSSRRGDTSCYRERHDESAARDTRFFGDSLRPHPHRNRE